MLLIVGDRAFTDRSAAEAYLNKLGKNVEIKEVSLCNDVGEFICDGIPCNRDELIEKYGEKYGIDGEECELEDVLEEILEKEDVLKRFYMSYRDGEKEETVYAKSFDDAVNKVADYTDWMDMWEEVK